MRFMILLLLCIIGKGQAVLAATPVMDASAPAERPIKSITILTDESLIVPLNVLARDYSRAHRMSVTTNIGNTPAHIIAIEEGAEANVLITPNQRWIATLQQKGLIDIYSRTPVIHNRMVLTGAQYMRMPTPLNPSSTLRDFSNNPLDFMMNFGDPALNAEGIFGIAILRKMGLIGEFEPHYHFFSSMYEMMETLEMPDSVGFTYRSEALLFPNVRILQSFDTETSPPVSYEAVVIAGENMEEAREFITYLLSDHAQAIFTRYGFDAIPATPLATTDVSAVQ
jgi:molybdate transport system substrate-binding protein